MNGVVTPAAKKSRQINVVIRHQDATGSVPSVSMETPASNALSVARGIPQEVMSLEALKELDRLIGLDSVKELVYEIYALLQISQFRAEAGLVSNAQVYHMVFKGNPGTGKTTVARIMGKLFQAMGVLSKGHLIEVERADLVGEYIGHTALKTRELVKKAIGGILFIDEAYSLARGGEKDFGKEAVDCLVKSMEDHKNQFILILAGYSEEMDYFLSLNPGMPSRFPIQIDFPDYTVDQLMQIANLMLKDREYTFNPTTEQKLRGHLSVERDVYAFSNARHVRNLIEKSMRHQAVRLLAQNRQPTRQELMMIRPEDLKFEKGPSFDR